MVVSVIERDTDTFDWGSQRVEEGTDTASVFDDIPQSREQLGSNCAPPATAAEKADSAACRHGEASHHRPLRYRERNGSE